MNINADLDWSELITELTKQYATITTSNPTSGPATAAMLIDMFLKCTDLIEIFVHIYVAHATLLIIMHAQLIITALKAACDGGESWNHTKVLPELY